MKEVLMYLITCVSAVIGIILLMPLILVIVTGYAFFVGVAFCVVCIAALFFEWRS